jgi:hypothetical protein
VQTGLPGDVGARGGTAGEVWTYEYTGKTGGNFGDACRPSGLIPTWGGGGGGGGPPPHQPGAAAGGGGPRPPPPPPPPPSPRPRRASRQPNQPIFFGASTLAGEPPPQAPMRPPAMPPAAAPMPPNLQSRAQSRAPRSVQVSQPWSTMARLHATVSDPASPSTEELG